MNGIAYKLKKPIQWGEEIITELTLREIELGDMEAWELGNNKMPMKDVIQLIADLAGLLPGQVKKLKMDDIKPLFEHIKKHAPAGL